MKTNPTVQKAVKIATLAGSAILVVNAALALTKATGVRSAAMPVVTILVGVAAFNYALGSSPVIVKKP